MKPINLKGLDQSEVQITVERLRLHAANLRGLVAASTGETVDGPTLTGDCIENVATLTDHVTQLEGKLGAKAPSFDVKPASSSPAGRKFTGVTEACLAARGVSSFEELHAKQMAAPARLPGESLTDWSLRTVKSKTENS